MPKIDLDTPKRITSEQIGILARVVKDIFFFATFVFVIHPVEGKVIFDIKSIVASADGRL